jgi:uncharacterized membrane protein YkvA (DUF1232 family)
MAVFDRINVIALWLAARDARTPVLAKVVAAGVTAYALSPIDLIPDVVPVLGYLDDLLIVPPGILLAVWLIPAPLTAEFREAAASRAKPVSRAGLPFIVVVWLVVGGALSYWALGAGLRERLFTFP